MIFKETPWGSDDPIERVIRAAEGEKVPPSRRLKTGKEIVQDLKGLIKREPKKVTPTRKPRRYDAGEEL